MLNSLLDDRTVLKQGEEVLIPIEFKKSDKESSKIAMFLNSFTDYNQFEQYYYDKVFESIKEIFTDTSFQHYLPGELTDVSITDDVLLLKLKLDRDIVRLVYPCPLSVISGIKQINYDWYNIFWKTYSAFPIITGIHKVFCDNSGNLFVLELYRLEFVINDKYADYFANCCIHYDSKFPTQIKIFSQDDNVKKLAESFGFEVDFYALS